MVDIEYGEDEVRINNKVYTMKLKVGPGSYELDYSLSIVNRDGRHTEYALFGYDVLKYKSINAYWFPKRLPYYMNMSSGRTWEVPKPGPIRMYAFRNSTQVYETFEIGSTGNLTHTIIDDELLHTEVISVAVYTNYFTWTFSGTWLRATTLNYSTYITMINGNDTDRKVFPTNRVKWGTVYSTKYNKYINGSFASDHRQHRSYDLYATNDASYSYFLTMYNEYFGTSIFMTSEALKSLESDGKKDQGWVWTSADFARRVMSYDSIYFNVGGIFRVDKKKGNTFLIKAAGMIHGGGSPTGEFYDVNTWVNATSGSKVAAKQYGMSDAVKIPDMYYRMFTGENNPTIIGVPEILYYAEDWI
jgi:hypothetical protein